MKKPNAHKSKQMHKKQIKNKINGIITKIAIIVLILSMAYIARGVFVHFRSNRIANETRNINRKDYSTGNTEQNIPDSDEIESEGASKDIGVQIGAANAEEALPTDELSMPTVEDEEKTDIVESEIVADNELIMQEEFTELYERNNDLIGWIYINENIDYPIVWLDEDNDFYMNHDYDKNYSDEGWIFLDKRNVAEMTDDHLLIYGHNMRVGTMFGELDRFRELDYLGDHPIIEIQSIYDEEPTKYVIIAIFDASMNKSHSTYIKITKFNFETPEEKQSYIDSICARSIFDLPCDATADDQLVTLVTCSYSYPNGRLLVVARELREDETVEQITEMYQDLK